MAFLMGTPPKINKRPRTRQIRRRLASDARYKAAFERFKPTAEGDAGMMQVMRHSLPLHFADPEKNLPVFARTIEGTIPSSFAAKKNMAANHGPQIDSTSRLGEIKAKTLIVVGKQDWICPVIFPRICTGRLRGRNWWKSKAVGISHGLSNPSLSLKQLQSFWEREGGSMSFLINLRRGKSLILSSAALLLALCHGRKLK